MHLFVSLSMSVSECAFHFIWMYVFFSDSELEKFANDEDAVVMIDKFISQLEVVITCKVHVHTL